MVRTISNSILDHSVSKNISNTMSKDSAKIATHPTSYMEVPISLSWFHAVVDAMLL